MRKIVVVDRNPHIRRLVQRELTSAGYMVFAPVSETELMDLFSGKNRVDLLIIDPEVLGNNLNLVTNRICEFYPDLPVIVHSLAVDKDEPLPFKAVLGRIEKNWDSIGELKKVMAKMITRNSH